MNLKRPAHAGALISLVPMVDVMLILLVFFMVTSTYLNLDMIPAVRPSEAGAAQASATPEGTVMIRIGADGAMVVQGTPLDATALGLRLVQELAEEPLMQVLILPSGAAPTQALISVMDAAAMAGVQHLRVLRLEPRR
ncbi:ExbD/TolR family protein [Parasedimentitalea psychrophila]|uniref:Biopolymer transporter ExbD n=1 Tax=Parasedimentitalea psychrophila TaxID=2997337 RepID=A0A9Y2P5D7_9RHOB|nr:biopolymer transporter ExbD [Parasedimentitalea psychrophila]WIY27812.1 biopolymer transporter ExbD [Parasedimentitalea psychrophila]